MLWESSQEGCCTSHGRMTIKHERRVGYRVPCRGVGDGGGEGGVGG